MLVQMTKNVYKIWQGKCFGKWTKKFYKKSLRNFAGQPRSLPRLSKPMPTACLEIKDDISYRVFSARDHHLRHERSPNSNEITKKLQIVHHPRNDDLSGCTGWS